MNLIELKSNIENKLSHRDYYGMFEIIDSASNEYLEKKINELKICIELITQNQDLYEYMGASKQFEMAFDLHNKIIANRNKLFLSCFNENQQELKPLFKRCVGDFSTEY